MNHVMKPQLCLICPLCGGVNQCAPAEAGVFDVECWCNMTAINPEAIARIPADLTNKACLCPGCATGLERVMGIEPTS